MGELSEFRAFEMTDSNNYSGQNFNSYLFDSIDFRGTKNNASFYRCDFRNTRIVNSFFYENNFDRADFVDSALSDTHFDKCEFGTDFINTYFYNCSFSANSFNGCSLIQCFFVKCTFSSNDWKESDIRNCQFDACSIENDIYEMNTCVDLTFKNSELKRVNLANQSAFDFKFHTCTLKNITVDPDYFGSYLFTETDFSSLKYSYRGQLLETKSDLLKNIGGLGKLYESSKRFVEMYNVALLMGAKTFNDRQLTDIFKTSLDGILNLDHPLKRVADLKRLKDTLCFYVFHLPVGYHLFFFQIYYLKEKYSNESRLEERIILFETINSLENMFASIQFNWKASFPTDEFWTLRFRIPEQEEKVLIDSVNTISLEVIEQLGPQEGKWEVVSREKGSLVIYIAASAGLCVFLITCIRKFTTELINIKLNIKTLHKLNNEKKFLKDKDYKEIALKTIKATHRKDVIKSSKRIKNLTLDEIEVIVDSFQ